MPDNYITTKHGLQILAYRHPSSLGFFYFKNQRTVMPVAHARGVILAALEEFQIPIYEYTPMEVKQVLTGYGRADKKEVEHMVKLTLGLESLPKLDDTVDSIAIAICHTRSVYE